MTTLPALPEVPAIDALAAWLADADAAVPDLRPGAERRIVWAGQPGQRTRLALVYLHGFSANPMETAPLCDQVAAALGANLYYSRFAGHGRGGPAMAEASLADWLADTAEAIAIGQALAERVVLVGCSTGGTLATIAAGSPAGQQLAGLVLMAPNFGPRAPGSFLLTWPFAEQLAHSLLGRERKGEAVSAAHAAHWTLDYPTRALLPMAQSVALAWRQPFKRMQQPLLAVWCEQDETVQPRLIRKALDRWAAAPLERLVVPAVADESGHVLAGDIFAPSRTDAVAAAMAGFLRKLP